MKFKAIKTPDWKAWWMESDCGSYSVSKAMVGDEAKYTPWHSATILGGPFNNSADAVKCCEDHQKKRAKA